MGSLIKPLQLQKKDQMDTLVEFNTKYKTDLCELYIFETHQTTHNVSLRFDNLTFTSMIRGRKEVKLGNQQSAGSFAYLPGSSVLVAPQEEMLIDFPEADEQPSQCLALSINETYLNDFLEKHNNEQPKINDDSVWNITSEIYCVSNNNGLASATNNILRIMMEDSQYKDQLIDLAMKELVIRLMHTQAQTLLQQGKTKGRFAELIAYIKSNLHEKLYIEKLANFAHLSKSNFHKLFKQELGISPNDYILNQRIHAAKKLLQQQQKTINEVAYETGFTDANYFIKTFKRIEGITPKHFQLNQLLVG